MSYELLEKFTQTVLPSELEDAIQKGIIKISKNWAKMATFATNNNLSNKDIDYWMALSPKRQKDENFIDYKDRQKFQNALIKYRPFLYQYNLNLESI
jgi:hypothetical protein